jgi:hypothetical protein
LIATPPRHCLAAADAATLILPFSPRRHYAAIIFIAAAFAMPAPLNAD